jgi:ribosomal protein S18 acetylase RimI-like enzyme
MVTLRPMTESEYTPYIAFLREDYARERAESRQTSIDEERAISNQQTESLVPQGLATPQHYFWTVLDGDGAAIGSLWVFVELALARAFIYDIALAAEQRGKGYGRQTLDALEEAMRAMGVTRITLNVFAKNAVARHLYDRQGYYVVATTMQKDL